MNDKLKKLHEILVSKGIDNKSFDEFKNNFSNNIDKQKKLHALLIDKGIDNKDFSEFQSNFFSTNEEQEVKKKEESDSFTQEQAMESPTSSVPTITLSEEELQEEQPAGVFIDKGQDDTPTVSREFEFDASSLEGKKQKSSKNLSQLIAYDIPNLSDEEYSKLKNKTFQLPEIPKSKREADALYDLPVDEYGNKYDFTKRFIPEEQPNGEVEFVDTRDEDLAQAIDNYEKSKRNLSTTVKEGRIISRDYLDKELDFNPSIDDQEVIRVTNSDPKDYLSWKKENVRKEGGAYKFFKNLLTNEEGENFEKEQKQYLRASSYKASTLNKVQEDIETIDARINLTTNDEEILRLENEKERLKSSYKKEMKELGSLIEKFPKFKEKTRDLDKERRSKIYNNSIEGSSFGDVSMNALSSSSEAIVDMSVGLLSSIPSIVDQIATASGFEEKGVFAGMTEMLLDTSEHYSIEYGAAKRSAFIQGKSVDYEDREYIVSDDGQIYDAETNILVTDLISEEKVSEILDISKDSNIDETNFDSGAFIENTASTLANLFGLIKGAGTLRSVSRNVLPKAINKKISKEVAGRISMGATSYATSSASTVQELKNDLMDKGLTEKEATEKAIFFGNAIASLDGVFSGLAGSNEKLLSSTSGIKKILIDLAKKDGAKFTTSELKRKGNDLVKENLKEVGVEELPVLFSEKAINDVMNKSLGMTIRSGEVTSAEILETLFLTLGATTSLGTRGLLKNNTRSSMLDLLSQKDVNYEKYKDELVNQGSITNEEADSVIKEIKEYTEANSIINNTIKVSSNKRKAARLIKKQRKLKERLKNTEPSLSEDLENQIEEIDNSINELKEKDKRDLSRIKKGDDLETTPEEDPFASEEDGGLKLKEQASQRLLDRKKESGEEEFTITDEEITEEALKIQEENRRKEQKQDIIYAKRDIGDGKTAILKIEDGQKTVVGESQVPEGTNIIEESEADAQIETTQEQDVSEETTQEDIEAREQEIESRRREELEPIEQAIAISNETGETPTVNDKVVSVDDINEINAKYDAELEALNRTQSDATASTIAQETEGLTATQTTESKKAEIEKKRQEELDNTQEKKQVGLGFSNGKYQISTITQGESGFLQDVELTKDEKKELQKIEADEELDGKSTETTSRRALLAQQIIDRLGLEGVTAVTDNIINAKYDAELESLSQIESTQEQEVSGRLNKPSQEQISKDIEEGNLSTFTYKNEESVPNVFKDKVSSIDNVTGEHRVTLSKSEADYLLQESESDTQETGDQTVKGNYEKAKETFKSSRNQASKSNRSILDNIKKALIKFSEEVFDRQRGIKKMLNSVGMDKVVDFIVTKAGANSLAKFRSETAYKNTFEGLTNKEIEQLEDIIILRRNISIAENRANRGLDPLDVENTGGLTASQSEKALEGYKSELGNEKYNNLFQRSEAYFDEYKKILREMRDEGLITEETYQMFAEVNYQPREFLDFMENMDGEFLTDQIEIIENMSLNDKQIKGLKGGYKGNQLTDAWFILQRSLLTRTRNVFANRVNKTFVEEFQRTKNEVEKLRKKDKLTKKEKKKIKDFENVEKRVKDDKIIDYTERGNPIYESDGKNIRGFKALFYYTNGVKQKMLLEEKLHDQINDTNNKYINNPSVREALALASGTSSIKTLATGNNPFFFITNTPRDFLFTLLASREYGNEVLSNGVKLAIDSAKGVRDVIKGNANYQKYLEYGGGMDWLALQGKFNEKGFLQKGLNKVMNQKTQRAITRNRFKRFMDKFNLASEVGMRLAVFNRSVKNQLKGRNMSDLKKSEQDAIYTKAARSARELSDFNQGGRTFKTGDIFIPYLNAATQGTRAGVEAFNERPLETSIRAMQLTAYTVASTISMSLGLISMMRGDDDEEDDVKKMTNSEIYLKTLEFVSQYDLENYFIIPTGKKNKEGNWEYYRIAKAQTLTPFINTAEHYSRKSLSVFSGGSYKGDLGSIMKNTVEKNILPIELSPTSAVSGIPIVSASFAMEGIDAYTGNPLSWDRGEIPEQLEGITDDRVEPLFREIGLATNQAPIRLQKATESFITTPSTNPYIAGAYALGNLTTSNKTIETTYSNVKEDIKRALTGRMRKHTNPYNEFSKIKESVSGEILEAYKKHMTLEKKVRENVRKYKSEDISEEKLYSNLKELAGDSPDEIKRIISWGKSEAKKRKVLPLINSLKYERNKEARAFIIAEKYGDIFLDTKKLEGEERKVFLKLRKERVIDSEVYNYYKKMMSK